MKKALITGILGQDGSHLAEFLLAKGYQVFGTTRHTGGLLREPISSRVSASLLDRIELADGDLGDQISLARLLEKILPDEIYNLACISFVPASWQEPVLTAELSAVGVTRLLDAMRHTCPRARFFQASSSEMFGLPPCQDKEARVLPQGEISPFYPRSPYGIAKVYGHHITVSYRESYSLYAASGILFNHEGPRRGLEFVTRKITRGVARIKLGLDSELRLGNLQAKRDWGYAGDYVRAMWLMLQQDKAEDFVIGTGATHSVEEFVEIAFDRVGLDWKPYVVVDPRFYRPAEAALVADNSKALRVLGWQPDTSFAELVAMMVDADMELVHGERRRETTTKTRKDEKAKKVPEEVGTPSEEGNSGLMHFPGDNDLAGSRYITAHAGETR